MFIIISNNPNKEIDPINYDRVYYLGFSPEKELDNNEFIIHDSHYLNDYIISLKGVCKLKKAIDKSDLEANYKRGINQIVLNDRETNTDWTTPTGETIIFVSKGNHRELEI